MKLKIENKNSLEDILKEVFEDQNKSAIDQNDTQAKNERFGEFDKKWLEILL